MFPSADGDAALLVRLLSHPETVLSVDIDVQVPLVAAIAQRDRRSGLNSDPGYSRKWTSHPCPEGKNLYRMVHRTGASTLFRMSAYGTEVGKAVTERSLSLWPRSGPGPPLGPSG